MDSEAATADPVFSAANVWNHLGSSGFNVVNPSYSNLVDSNGNPTGVGFAITGSISAYGTGNASDALLDDVPTARTTDPKAHALHLQAVQLARARSPESYARSDSLYREVLAIDPGYAPSWINLASNLVNEVFVGARSAEDGFPGAEAAANKALEIDPNSAHAHMALGTIAVATGDLAAAANHFERALELDPAPPTVLGNSSMLLKSLGRLDEAIALDEETVRRDPVNTAWLFNLAAAKHWGDRNDESIELLRTALSLGPGFNGARLILGEALLGKGDPAAALARWKRSRTRWFA